MEFWNLSQQKYKSAVQVNTNNSLNITKEELEQ